GTPAPAARAAYAAPRARIAEARWLAERRLPHALIDLSDGLAGDVAHIAAASQVRIILDAASIPVHEVVSDGARSRDDALRLALGGGEDYELCFTSEAGAVQPLVAGFATRFGLPLTRVGWVEEGAGVALRTDAGEIRPLDISGYRHFG
ncbi:MAG: thiamine-phosphate kinase, partial [Longimicrobiales bacterium]